MRRSGVHVSWILAVIIAAIGVIRYAGSCEKNPITGKMEAVALSPEQEVRLGARTAPQMIQEMGGAVPDSDPRSQLVDEVGQKLVAQIAPPAGGTMPWRFDFHLLRDSRTVNAFALPGGQCFITLALFNQLQNEAQLAGVLGHEIGHVIERHGAERLAKQQLGQSLVTAVGVGASGSGDGYTAAQAAAMANQFIQLKYGREDELESDSLGVEYMVKAGYDPEEMVGVMEILKKAGGGGNQPEFSSTHPHPENRAEQIRQKVKALFPGGVPRNLTKGRVFTRG